MKASNWLAGVAPGGVILVLFYLVLMLLAPRLLRLIFSDADEKRFRDRVNLFRLACFLGAVLEGVRMVAHPTAGSLWFTRLFYVLLIIYGAYLLFYMVSGAILRRWGRPVQREERQVYIETYNSRMLSLLAAVVIFVIALVAIIRVLGYTSWLEAGGVLGVLGVMLALTQGSWVPDLVSGLVILNTRLIEEGDVIQLSDNPADVGMVFRTKLFFTEFLHLANNHRILIQNSRLRAMTVQNLSRFASARGLRESLVIQVGYEVTEQQVRRLFEAVMEEAAGDDAIAVESQYEPEIRCLDAGDYAVRWACFYYTKDARNLLRTRHLLTAVLLRHAREHGISLATPVLVDATAAVGGIESGVSPGAVQAPSLQQQ